MRPKKDRIVKFSPDVSYFKPRGIPMMDLEEITLTIDESEAIRLADFIGMSHEEAGGHMGVSRATFGRIVQKARKAIADALINGKAIRIEGGNFQMIHDKQLFACCKCEHEWEEENIPKKPDICPSCSHNDITVKKERKNDSDNRQR